MKAEAVFTTIDNRGVARLTFNRHECRNAFDEALIDRICDEIGRLSSDTHVRAIVLTGAGSAFCAGADVAMMARAADNPSNDNKDDARRLSHMLQSIYTAPVPTIAFINGPTIAAGIGVACACDIAIAADHATFAFSEVRFGLTPAVISPYVIEAIGARQARRYFLTGEKFDCETALRLGLVHAVAPAARLDNMLNAIVTDLRLGGPEAQNETKDLIRNVSGRPIEERLIEGNANRIARIRSGDEGREGIAAYLEKRPPTWVTDG